MTNPKENAKKTGDIHPPDVESEPPFQESSRDRGKASARGQESRPGRGIRKAGVPEDKDDETSENYSTARESGEGSGGNRA